jgi:hypothetical protein
MLVDELVTPWYHCISRCVRRAFLCGPGAEHRKVWIENRIQELVGIFAIECGGFAILDNHVHLLLRLDSALAGKWSDADVARRWLTLFPICDQSGNALPVSEPRVKELAGDSAWVASIRSRLVNLGWFMKCLKEPLAKMANREDGCTGVFWEGRFKSVAVLDEESLLATAAYIDLNPVAAGSAPTPEDSLHTSFRARVDFCRTNGTIDALRSDLSTLTDEPEQESGLWLLPVNDRRRLGSQGPGLVVGCTLACYVRLIDWTSRLIREGKASLDPGTASLFARLGIDPTAWETTIGHLAEQTQRCGSYFGRADRLAEAARAHGRRWHRNQFRRVPEWLRPVA